MPNTDARILLYAMLGGIDGIASDLGIENEPEALQHKALEHVAGIVWKRVLLRVPDEKVESVQSALATGDMDKFTAALENALPDLHRVIENELRNAIAEFARIK